LTSPSKTKKTDTNTNSKKNTPLIVTKSGKIPFSTGYLAESLLVLGITLKEAYKYAEKISRKLKTLDQPEIKSSTLMELIIREFQESKHPYAIRAEFLRNDLKLLRPLVVLLSGVTGIGKSTISLLISQRFKIESLLGSDFVREVFRSAINPRLMPTIHFSSYEVGDHLGLSISRRLNRHIIGFEEQARKVMVGIEATIDYVISQRDTILIEGVHGIPYLLKEEYVSSEHVVPILLTLEDEELHYNRLKKRERLNPNRKGTHVKYFDRIRSIQAYLIERCKDEGFPVVDLKDEYDAVTQITEEIWKRKLSSLS